MFEAAISKFVKTVGQESLLPVPSLDQADRCRPLQVVVKKNRRWYWQSAKYEPTPFHLHQLLTQPDPLTPDEAKISTRKLTNYNKTYSFSLDGKIGGQLKALIDVELSGDDMVNIEAKFGDITKEEVDQPELMKTLQSKQLDVKHEFLEQVCENPRKVLCVIVGVAKTTEDGSIHMKTDIKAEEEVKAGDIINKVVNPDEDTKMDDANDKSLLIPADTPLAYNICEITVKANGALELMVEKDASKIPKLNTKGGFESRSSTEDEVDGLIQRAGSMTDDYRPLYQLPQEDRNKMNTHVLNLCKCPLDVLSTFLVLKRANESKEDGTDTLENMKKVDEAKYILQQAGFEIKDDLSVTYPKEKSSLFNAIFCLFEALMELDDDETIALGACNGDLVAELLELLTSALHDKPLKTGDAKISALYSETGTHQMFAQTLGFKNENGTVKAVDNNGHELEGALRSVYALWWDANKHQKPSSRCTLL